MMVLFLLCVFVGTEKVRRKTVGDESRAAQPWRGVLSSSVADFLSFSALVLSYVATAT